jgi:hypothetical protein
MMASDKGRFALNAYHCPVRAEPPGGRGGGQGFEAAIKANANIQADPDADGPGKLKVATGYYDIGCGRVSLPD